MYLFHPFHVGLRELEVYHLLPFNVGSAVLSPLTGAMLVASTAHTLIKKVVQEPLDDQARFAKDPIPIWKLRAKKYAPEVIVGGVLAATCGVEAIGAYLLYRGVGKVLEKIEQYGEKAAPTRVQVNSTEKPLIPGDAPKLRAQLLQKRKDHSFHISEDQKLKKANDSLLDRVGGSLVGFLLFDLMTYDGCFETLASLFNILSFCKSTQS